ncbi:MAG: YqgE/AlgH family protein, partial [Vicinamibacterales bacterium]
RPLVTSGTVMVDLDPPVATDRELDIWVGGPVEPQRSWILVGGSAEQPEVYGAAQIADGVYLSASPELLRRLLEPQPPANARLVVGYAGWAPGQLEQELAESAWLLSDVDADLVFKTNADQMWERAIRRLGADPGTLTMSRGIN